MQYAQLPGLRMAYDTAGDSGSPVILIMGYAARGLAWRRQVPALAENYRVAWFDNRSCGSTEAPRGPITMRQFAQDTRHLLDHLGWERAHIVGVSMGGMIAQHLALNHRTRCLSLSLIATHAGGATAALPPKAGRRLIRKGLYKNKGMNLLQLLMSDAHIAASDTRTMLAGLNEEFDHRSKRRQGQQLAAILRHNTRSRLHRLQGLPTLIIQPEADKLVSPHHSRFLADTIPGARLLTIPQVGHGLLREVGDVVSEALLKHFAGTDLNR